MKKNFSASITYNGKLTKKYFYTKEDSELWKSEIRSNYLDDVSLDGEIWMDIPNYSRYEASNYGRIRSLNYKMSGAKRIIKSAKSKDGYLQSMFLCDDGKYKTKKIHFLIALAFFGERKDGLEVNHIDGNKENNFPNNLEYVTRSENCLHSFRIGLQKPKRGELNGMSKLTKEQVDYARKLKSDGGRYWGRNELAKEYGVTPKNLQKIVNNLDIW